MLPPRQAVGQPAQPQRQDCPLQREWDRYLLRVDTRNHLRALRMEQGPAAKRDGRPLWYRDRPTSYHRG
ncbi:hypothetical protein Tter_2148 [Thermobaculum terrenum ATCC BAA-798]|uniref:Uncharacterized protein n=1 Tax=Thermobaculum terrenum (strain ATCC BAA-798 / CCMEE 7001 / YNP1) TaxID=525904 RepID=D1CH28_THET1|nr:hypothetical protein [Thermobaculum terrenum]ACZ43049.1 hypothetical protein Tter_2148 [Thermobaculum terrenum ATCC BAA-798]